MVAATVADCGLKPAGLNGDVALLKVHESSARPEGRHQYAGILSIFRQALVISHSAGCEFTRPHDEIGNAESLRMPDLTGNCYSVRFSKRLPRRNVS